MSPGLLAVGDRIACRLPGEVLTLWCVVVELVGESHVQLQALALGPRPRLYALADVEVVGPVEHGQSGPEKPAPPTVTLDPDDTWRRQ